jgi:hypothetical protein
VSAVRGRDPMSRCRVSAASKCAMASVIGRIRTGSTPCGRGSRRQPLVAKATNRGQASRPGAGAFREGTAVPQGLPAEKSSLLPWSSATGRSSGPSTTPSKRPGGACPATSWTPALTPGSPASAPCYEPGPHLFRPAVKFPQKRKRFPGEIKACCRASATRDDSWHPSRSCSRGHRWAGAGQLAGSHNYPVVIMEVFDGDVAAIFSWMEEMARLHARSVPWGAGGQELPVWQPGSASARRLRASH